jgi:hypothetical protein
MTEYIPHLLGRMGAVRFAENISPHGLARAFQQQIGFGWSEKAGALINKSFYAYALPYVAYNLALDYKAYRVGFLSRPETFAVIAASYLPAMLFFPSLVYAYSGIVLLLLFAVLESRPAATLIPNSLRFFLPVLEVGAAFNAVAYALMTNDVHFHAIPQFAVAALSLCAVLVKRRLLAADADVDATAASKATVSWNVRNRPNDQHHYRQPGRVNHGTALPDG